jgi:formamidopyrimidine-DNA glycosylase
MPEYPEVAVHGERLTSQFGGRTLERFSPINFAVLKTAQPAPTDVVGCNLVEVTTRGKLLIAGFGRYSFVIHLMQGGRLKPDEKQSAKPRGGLGRWHFDDGSALLLTEAGSQRKAGTWVIEGDPLGQPPLDHLGPDAVEVGVDALAGLLATDSKRLHGVLRDQRRIAGLGRRLANEICHRAKLSPFAAVGKLDASQVERLHTAIHDCISESLEFESGRDDMSSSAERPGAVHHRTGESCPACDDVVRAVEYNAYTVNYCATCQTDGKVLADNTTSKFLK